MLSKVVAAKAGIETAAPGHRHPGTDEQARGRLGDRVAEFGVPHDPGDAAVARVVRPVHVLRVGQHAHGRVEGCGKIAQFGTGVVACHLIPGDDHDLAGAPPIGQALPQPQQSRGVVRMSDRRRHERRKVHLGLLDILGQQQDCRSTGECGGDRAGQVLGDAGRVLNPGAVPGDRAEQRRRIDGPRAATGVLERAAALERSRGLANQGKYRHS